MPRQCVNTAGAEDPELCLTVMKNTSRIRRKNNPATKLPQGKKPAIHGQKLASIGHLQPKSGQDIALFLENEKGMRYLEDAELRDVVLEQKWHPKKRLAMSKKLFKWSKLLAKSVSPNAKAQMKNFDGYLTSAPDGIWSVFIEDPDLKNFDSATVGRIAARYKFWAEELQLEIKRREAEKLIGNPQN